MHGLSLWLTICATVLGGLLAGVSLDKTLVQLPARKRIGNAAYAAYSRAADLRAGLFWYPLLGILAPIAAITAAVFVLSQGLASPTTLPACIGAGLAVLHLFMTSRAAPRMLRVRSSDQDEAALERTFRGFEKWNRVRFGAQLAAFLVITWSLIEQVRS
jgi:hypothetical protein